MNDPRLVDERVREGVTMALYIGLSLLAVLLALPSDVAEASSTAPALILTVTSLGLMLAHMVAFRISSRLINRGELDPESMALVGAQTVGGLVVTAVAVVPVVVIGGDIGVLAAQIGLLVLISGVSYFAVRSAPIGRWRAIAYAVGVVVATFLVIGIKGLVGH